MKRYYFFLAIILTTLVLPWSLSFADNDDDDFAFWKKKPGIVPVTNALYREECGSCHFAYPPGLLPERSWQKIMSNLADHFGDNAELSVSVNRQILTYLSENAADRINYRRSRSIARSIARNSIPLRITDVPYIRHEHDEIPSRLIVGNDKVVSLSRCESCHQTAEDGYFTESQISIPGVGRWSD